MYFVYVKIPAVADSTVRDRRIADAIEEALCDRGIGSVLGWGSSMGDLQADGTRLVQFHRIDIEVTELSSVRVLFYQLLPEVGAPVGTEIHYTINRNRLQDIYRSPGWEFEQPLSRSSVKGAAGLEVG